MLRCTTLFWSHYCYFGLTRRLLHSCLAEFLVYSSQVTSLITAYYANFTMSVITYCSIVKFGTALRFANSTWLG